MPLPYSPLLPPSAVRPSGRRWWRRARAIARRPAAGDVSGVAHPVLALHDHARRRRTGRSSSTSRNAVDDGVGVDDHDARQAGRRRRARASIAHASAGPLPRGSTSCSRTSTPAARAISTVRSVQWSATTCTRWPPARRRRAGQRRQRLPDDLPPRRGPGRARRSDIGRVGARLRPRRRPAHVAYQAATVSTAR